MDISLTPVIKASNIVARYKNKTVIEDISLEIPENKIVSIIGPNGSGKTTLLKVLSRNFKPGSGHVLLNGRDIFTIPYKSVAKQMAVLSQSHSSPGDFTVRQLVSFGRYAHREWWKAMTEKDYNIVEWAMEVTEILHLSNRKISTLSGGELQRARMAMCLAQKPKILILDEPTTFLDICHQLELLELVYSLNKKEGITVVMVLHDINQAARYSDEIIVIKDGRKYMQGSPQKVITSNMLKEVFNVFAYVSNEEYLGCPVFYPVKMA